MQWTNTAGSSVDLTHLADLESPAVGVGIVYSDPQLVASVQGSSYLITVEAATAGTAYTTLIVDHLDPSGNTVWSQKLPGVYATFEDGPTVVKGPCYAADIRVTVGTGNGTLVGAPVDPVVRVYSSPNEQQRPTRVVNSSMETSTMTDAFLGFGAGNMSPGDGIEFFLRPYAGLATITASSTNAPIEDFTVFIDCLDSSNTSFSVIQVNSPNGLGEVSLPAAVSRVEIGYDGTPDPANIRVTFTANDFTL